MTPPNSYVDLRGQTISLSDLDDEERKLVGRLKQRAKSHPDWNDYENYWTKTVPEFYQERGLSRKQVVDSVVWRIAQDLGSRIGIDAGLVRMPDYRDELADLIRRRFKTRREFCQATGISEDMLSHVLARRKHMAIDTLMVALSRIGCTLHIMPMETTPSQS